MVLLREFFINSACGAESGPIHCFKLARLVSMESTKTESRSHSSDGPLALLKMGLDIDRLAEYIDRNILTFRHLPYAVGLIGAAVAFRSIRLSTKFTQVSQIPESFVRKHVQLRGKIKDVDLDGTLEVEHLAILSMPWHGLYKNPRLNVRLAFTSPTIPGVYWMRLNVSGKPIHFRLLDRSRDKRVLWASVKVLHSTVDSKLSLNEMLVQKGLARVAAPSEMEALSKVQAKVLNKLEICQTRASKEGLGIWSDGRHRESWLEASKRIIKGMLGRLTTRRQN